MKVTTQLIQENHGGELPDDLGDPSEETCCFCATETKAYPATSVLNEKYFSDYGVMESDTGYVCESCAYCLTADRSLKNGSWIAASGRYESVSTGDLPEAFGAIRSGDYETPLAVHLTESPIRSQHSYLWTPTVNRVDPLVLDLDSQRVTVEWDVFDNLLAAVEDYRWHGARLDDIRGGELRVSTIDSLGIGAYRRLERVVDPYRGAPVLDVAVLLSRSADDQDRDETQDGDTKLSKYA